MSMVGQQVTHVHRSGNERPAVVVADHGGLLGLLDIVDSGVTYTMVRNAANKTGQCRTWK